MYVKFRTSNIGISLKYENFRRRSFSFNDLLTSQEFVNLFIN
jgi:hypothetical protein